MSSQLVHALSLLFFSLHFLLSYFLSFCLSSLFPLFSISLFFFYVSCYSSFLLFTVHGKGFFILLAMIRFTVLPLNYFWPIVGVHPGLPTGLLAAQPPPLPCTSCAIFHSQTKGVLFYFLVFRRIPIQLRAGYSLLLIPIACT